MFISTKFPSKYNVVKTDPCIGAICIVHMEKTQNLVISKTVHFHREILNFKLTCQKCRSFYSTLLRLVKTCLCKCTRQMLDLTSLNPESHTLWCGHLDPQMVELNAFVLLFSYLCGSWERLIFMNKCTIPVLLNV